MWGFIVNTNQIYILLVTNLEEISKLIKRVKLIRKANLPTSTSSVIFFFLALITGTYVEKVQEFCKQIKILIFENYNSLGLVSLSWSRVYLCGRKAL